jgi:hypothetical protein
MLISKRFLSSKLLLGGEDVDDLAELVDRPVQVRPAPGDLHDEYGACKQS